MPTITLSMTYMEVTANPAPVGRYNDSHSLSPKSSVYRQYARTSHRSAGDHSTLVSPMTPRSTNSDPVFRQELDSTPVRREPGSAPAASSKFIAPADIISSMGDQSKVAARPEPPKSSRNNGSRGGTVQDPVERPRATLRATADERRSKTYVNSWTRFQNVQV